MKKAKLFLAAVAVMGLVGGAFAFKAKIITTKTYFVTSQPNVKPTLSVADAYTTAASGSGVLEYFTLTTTAIATNYSFVTTTTGE